jgi:hypothetical protein
MTEGTLLLRQIHPTFIQNGRVTSQAFRPTPKDENQLSVDNGDMISPEESWKRFSEQPECTSSGVMAVSQCECSTSALIVIEDGIPYPEHCYFDFAPFSSKQASKIGKKLAAKAHERGWLHQVK